jgi:RsiW-degrading membrane proteinase PrsW (M82 family)
MSSPGSSNLSQYNLRTLFAAVAILAAVFASGRYGGSAGLMAAATVAALIAAHVVGNALGTRLRDEVSPHFNPQPPTESPRKDTRRVPTTFGERRLHQRTPLGRIIHITSGGAALVGAVLGGLALAVWTDATPVGWLVGTVSSAVLGAFFGFLLASFLEMTLRAWWQASEGQERERERD